MHGCTSSKDSMHEVIGSKPALILDDSHVFNASYGMLYSYSERRYFFVVLFFFFRKVSAFGFFYRLKNNNSFQFIYLIFSTLMQPTEIREGIHCIGCLFIMYLSTNTWTDKKNWIVF